MPKVIITGGTGLVGGKLSGMLREKGYEVAVLTRTPVKEGEYKWDVQAKYIDPRVFDNAHAIIHLAGTSIADKPWGPAQKKEIIDSRVRSAALLYHFLKEHPNSIRSFISASAVGYYGDRSDEILKETSPGGTGFLPEVCRQWESAADQFSEIGIRVCKLRIGIVLSREGGALPKMDLPARFGLGVYFGNGQQYLPWIHINDVCRMFIYALENENIHGVYNACAPQPVTNKEMTRSILSALNRPFIPVPAPAFALNLILGERAQLVLMSDRCTSEKIQQSGFQFHFTEPGSALQDIYQNK